MKPYLELAIKRELDLIVNEMVKIIDADEIILFGSYACGIPHEYSNYDLCIVTDVMIDNYDSDDIYKNQEIWSQINLILYKVRGIKYVNPHIPTEEEMAYIGEVEGDPMLAIRRINEISGDISHPSSPCINCYFTTKENLAELSKQEHTIERAITSNGVRIYPHDTLSMQGKY